MPEKHIILGAHVTERVQNAAEVQRLLGEYGRCIRTRLGMHHLDVEGRAPCGVVVLEMTGDEGECGELKRKLELLPGLEVQEMVFEH
jgi:hypothetical protein